jgi:2-dehydro-3-deoxygalactonokinase
MADGVLIAVDWGTSRLRAMLVDASGKVIEERASGDGIGALDGGHEAAFERLVAGWPAVPAIMAGMIGSRQGWREAPYVPCPADAESLGGALLRFTTAAGRPVAIVPGLMLRSAARDGDVIRGEETQMIGLIDGEPGFSGTAVHPGTHSKWVAIASGRIADFQTYMSGEMFELLRHRSFLRHSVKDTDADLSAEPDFALAVRRTAVDGLPFLGAIFSTRVRALLDDVPGERNLAYLSGLVIGAEIAAARADGRVAGKALRVVASPALARAYAKALEIAALECRTLDGSTTVLAGLLHLARRAGLLA